MNIIRGQRRWSLLTGTTDGLMMIALNGVPIGEFNVQRFSIKWIRDLGHLRCDDFSHLGQPHSTTTTKPTSGNTVDPAGDGPKVPELVRTFDHVFNDLKNVYEDPQCLRTAFDNLKNSGFSFDDELYDCNDLGNVYKDPYYGLGNVYQVPDQQNLGNVYEQPNSRNLGNVYEQPNSRNLGNVYEQPNSRNLGNVYEPHPNPQNLGDVFEHHNPINSNQDNMQSSGSVSDSAGVREDSHIDIVEEGSGSIPESADMENVEQPPGTTDNFQCLRTAFDNLKTLDDELYDCNLGLRPENLDAALYDVDGNPKCKRRRVENDEEFRGTPTELMRIQIRESTPYRFNNVEFLRESATLDDKKNVKADMTEKIVAFHPVKQLGDHSYITEALVGGGGQKMVIVTRLATGLNLNNHVHICVITGFDFGDCIGWVISLGSFYFRYE